VVKVSHPALLVQTKIYEILCDDATLTGLLADGENSILDSVQEETVMPYITLGDDEFADWGSHTFQGIDGDISIRTWTQNRGRKKCKEIMSRIYDLLHGVDLSVTGYSTVSMRCVFLHTVVDPDGVTIQGIQRFKLLLGGI
jgi:uncharacterized protein DUF3168